MALKVLHNIGLRHPGPLGTRDAMHAGLPSSEKEIPMKSTRLAALAAVLALGGCLAEEPGSPAATDLALAPSPATPSALTPATAAPAVADRIVDPDDLVFLREEEKLARDVYLTLGALWNAPVFATIAESEQTHMDAALRLLETYRIADPVTDDTVGAFVNPTLDALYDRLVSMGEGSLEGALTAGATIEDLDLNDLQGMMARNTARDAARVLDSLACGSRNHLRSFVAQLGAIGTDYEAQYLTAEEMAEILAGAHESCGGQ